MAERAIFIEALDKPDPAERAAYLDKACAGDRELRQRIEALLRSHAAAGDFLDIPAAQQLAAGAGMLVDRGPSGAAASPSDERSDAEVPLDFLAPSPRPDSLGRLGHYEVLEIVGQGGMGFVFRAFDEKLHRVVAIKVLAPAMATTGSARQRFGREARAAAAVVHDNVIDIHSVEDQGPVPYLVMEFIDGPTLQQKLDRTGPLPLKEIVRIGMHVAAGLAAAHAQGLVHRDVKPSNILLENGVERVKITDFGLARAADDASLTGSGLVAGTPAYMSPEQADGNYVDQRSDLFSLGSVLYTLCAGHAPFRASTTMAVLKRVCEETPRSLRAINADMPEWMGAVVAKLHAKDPARRFQTAAEVAEILGRYLAHLQQPDRFPCPDAAEPERPTPARKVWHPWPLAAIAIGLLVAGLGIVAVARGGRPVVRIGQQADTPTEAEQWEQSVAGLPADQQIQAVAHRLKERNPGFDGKVIPGFADGQVVNLQVPVDQVRDISPLRALRGLVSLDLNGTFPSRGKLTDLTPLRGMRLNRLHLASSGVSNLEPLRGMPLTMLFLSETRVADLSPLKGARLEIFTAERTSVSDLEPLRGMPLKYLDLNGAFTVSDLGPLAGMPLEYLNVGSTQASDLSCIAGTKSLRTLVLDDGNVSDLSPIRGLDLTVLSIIGAPDIDLSPIRQMPLTKLRLTYRPEYARFLRSLATLQVINDRAVAEFWKGDEDE